MCGIVGILNQNRDASVDADVLRRMLATIRHRGPDEFGVYVCQGRDQAVGLGNARLSIIDLSGGQQPISNEDGTKWIVFNGEVFNYLELQKELQQQGHRLATHCDTEVILHLYEQYGPACVERLNGQFAFAVYDEKKGELFLARDRCGVRPVHYTRQGGVFLFASEIKAILAYPGMSAELDPLSLDQIFTFWSPLAPRTAFRGIRTLPPGHWMLVRRNGEILTKCYWRLGFPAAGVEPYRDIEEARHQFYDLLVDAIRLRLRADVPVGAYLSGGLDSSTIAALIHRHTGNRLETFSIAFTDQAFDESRFQSSMAEHLGTRHHLITCTHADIGRVFPEVIWHTEIPIMRTSPAPLFMLSELVQKQGFKVVLSGEGADEFLGGYDIFKEGKVRRFWARQPQSRWRPALLRKLYRHIGDLSKATDEYLRKFFGQGLGETDSPTYSHEIRWRNTSRTKRVFSEAMRGEIQDPCRRAADVPPCESWSGHELGLPAEFHHWSHLAQAQYLEATIFLSEYLLSSQGDRVSMAHSVEGRFPFLDHRVIGFCGQLSPRLKLRGLREKHLLKEIARELLPGAICNRPKHPYRAPIHASFFPDGKPLDWVADVLSPRSVAAAGCFNPQAVEMLVRKITRLGSLGETDDMALAGVLSTQLLHRLFVADCRAPGTLSNQDSVKTVIRQPANGNGSSTPELGDQRVRA